MNDKELIQALRGAMVETGSLLCLGCGYEHSCGIRGCAVIREAAERLEALTSPPKAPLPLKALREMDGEPVWCINGSGGQWCLVHVYLVEGVEHVECVTNEGFAMEETLYGAVGVYAWLAYHRKPEEGTA